MAGFSYSDSIDEGDHPENKVKGGIERLVRGVETHPWAHQEAGYWPFQVEDSPVLGYVLRSLCRARRPVHVRGLRGHPQRAGTAELGPPGSVLERGRGAHDATLGSAGAVRFAARDGASGCPL
ncbi:hypothetical protein [Clavibacter nebraskensis]|uniref:hypothetical protein n=1 Tax=Clavibacter nebraskensis TaxID=31963 RepID=UPI000AB141D8|nr:hypothetical protein [Clavibacter nebraskensis]